MARKLICSASILLFVQFALAQSFKKAKLDSFFQVLEVNSKFMGSVALSQNGKLLYTKQIGFADVEQKIKPNENTKYRIGSISKTFTATLVFKAIEEKKLKLTDKLKKYFPGIKNADKISISNLLNHRSGIPNFTDTEGYMKWYTVRKSEKELMAILEKSGSDFEPDAKAVYSNSNFVLLSFILQKVYKKDFSQILTNKITNPLGLKNTYFGKPTNLMDNESYSYTYNEKWEKEQETDMSIPLGAGAIVSTPSELVYFSEALFAGKIVSLKSLETMKAIKDNYGMGLFQIPFYDKIGFGHTGGIDGFTSVFTYFPSDKISFALTSNGTNMDNNSISIAMLSAAYEKPFDIPTFTTVQIASEDLDKYLGVYASKQIPLKITITKIDKTLVAQATGQASFKLEAAKEHIFKFDKAGVVLEFNPVENSMVLKQGGGVFSFIKE